jgi:hypothetical protein
LVCAALAARCAEALAPQWIWRLEPRALPDLRGGKRTLPSSRERRPAAFLRPVCRAVELAPLTCPFCANDDRALITSFATARQIPRARDVCRRYSRPMTRAARSAVMVAVDRSPRSARRGGDAARLIG